MLVRAYDETPVEREFVLLRVTRETSTSGRLARRVKISRVRSAAKRIIDIAGSLILLVCLSPLLLALAGLVATSGRPIIFSQQRIGKAGRPFRCFKFRTMVPQAEDALAKLLKSRSDLNREWRQNRKLKFDPRITSIGAFLRRTSLDELPQLLNVLKGDMSLVGPRPIVQYELEIYARAAVWYLAARPGITGLWQISGRSNVGYRRRIALDAYYVRNQSLLLDIGILLRTIPVVVRGSGAY